jgi:hypothetical protein
MEQENREAIIRIEGKLELLDQKLTTAYWLYQTRIVHITTLIYYLSFLLSGENTNLIGWCILAMSVTSTV